VCPGQWSWPVNIPPFFRIDGTFSDEVQTPWADEIEHKVFQPPTIGVGPANEVNVSMIRTVFALLHFILSRTCARQVVFFHKRSKSLIVTDLVVYLNSNTVPEVVDKAQLIEAAYFDDGGAPEYLVSDPLKASKADLRKGWQRMALQILFLGPPKLATFATVSDRLIVSPVIQTFVYNRVKEDVAAFVEGVCEWKFKQVHCSLYWPEMILCLLVHADNPCTFQRSHCGNTGESARGILLRARFW
jgi:hypothetical protein